MSVVAGSADSGALRPRRHRRRRRHPVLRWVLIGLVAVLLASAAWIAIRGLMARDALLGAVPQVDAARAAVLDGDPAAAQDALADVQRRSSEAAALTSDPVWRAAEVIPLVGANLIAFREAAAVVAGIAQDALPPLAEAAGMLQLSDLVPRDGALDVQPLLDARPLLEEGAAAMAEASLAAEQIQTQNTVPVIGEAVDQLLGLVDETSALIQGLAGAADILPAMLGHDGPRSYALLVLNNAELRAAGGIPGAIAEIRAEEGRLSLGEQTTATNFGRRADPLPISEAERTLFTDNLGLYVQNVTATPDFARTGELTAVRWEERYGERPDGVLAVDPVALSYVLRATGPVDVGDGFVLEADTAVATLLSDSYARYPEPDDQDAFFARSFASVFEALVEGDLDARAFIDALVQAGSERRLLVWSDHDDEQAVISAASISGPPAPSPDGRFGVGVYLHDVTESKMDWYLRAAIVAASVECRNDDRPFYELRVRLESTAPENAAQTLPDYVTGSRYEQGQIRTGVILYLPKGSTVYDTKVDGHSQAFTLAEDDRSVIASQSVILEPGQSAIVSYHVLGPADAPLRLALEHTPTAFDVPVSLDNLLACPTLPESGDEVSA